MRSLTIHVPGIPDSDASNLVEAHVFQDYDAIVVDPESFYYLYGKEASEKSSRYDNVLTHDFGGLCVEVNNRRHNEVHSLLDLGGVLICVLRPLVIKSFSVSYDGEEQWYQMTNYDWLFERKQMASELGDIYYSKGKTIDYIDNSHPFYQYLNTKPAWSAYIDSSSCNSWKILASAFGTHILSLSKRFGSGQILFIPSDYRSQNGELLAQSISKLMKNKEVLHQPSWVQELLLPGQEELQVKIGESNTQILFFENERNSLIAKNNELERWKLLLYAKGKEQFEPVVRDALQLIGFQVETQPDMDSDGLITSEFGMALCEIVGSNSTIKLEKFGELKKNCGNFISLKGIDVKGILIGNPFCEEPLDNRPPKGSQKSLFAKELILSAKNQGVSVLLTTDLYEFITRELNHTISDQQKESIRKKIFEGNGQIELF
ncbi:MAG: hypothetical protein ABSF24_12765 [Candidatus Bathyarchaeia archaeon]|jgi:hypothetical protein